jgi:acetoacetyl-CoA synthetase
MFFYSTTGWMMWNTLPWALLMNGSSVLYDGHPAHPAPDMLWGLAAKTGVTCFGTSPTSIGSMQKLGLRPKAAHDLTRIENIFMAGSPATPEAFSWLYENVNPDFWVTTQSGGTEFCSGLLAAVPLLPVYAAEIQARALGADVRALDEAGNELTGQTGELAQARCRRCRSTSGATPISSGTRRVTSPIIRGFGGTATS